MFLNPVSDSVRMYARLDDIRVYRYWRSPSWEAYHNHEAVCPLFSTHNPFFSSFVMSIAATLATTAASSESRQAIFQAALKSFQKQTKTDLLTHPLVSQLQSCESTTAILAILQDQVREFEKTSDGDERLTKWLGPTVNVLNAFSAAVSGGVNLVSFHS